MHHEVCGSPLTFSVLLVPQKRSRQELCHRLQRENPNSKVHRICQRKGTLTKRLQRNNVGCSIWSYCFKHTFSVQVPPRMFRKHHEYSENVVSVEQTPSKSGNISSRILFWRIYRQGVDVHACLKHVCVSRCFLTPFMAGANPSLVTLVRTIYCEAFMSTPSERCFFFFIHVIEGRFRFDYLCDRFRQTCVPHVCSICMTCLKPLSVGIAQKGSPGQCRFRFLIFFPVFFCFSPFFPFRFLPFRFFPFLSVLFSEKPRRRRLRDHFCESLSQ